MKTPKPTKPARPETPEDKPTQPETPDVNNRRIGILIGLSVFWLLILIVSIVFHSRLTTRMIPVVGVVGVAYAIYCSYRLLTKPK